jgi:hypothetical protein
MHTPWLYGLIFSLAILTSDGIPHRLGREAQPAAVSAVETWTIPGAGRTAGQNNTQFVSDLALTNLGTGTANVTISFVGPGGLPPKPITLAAGATTVYRNVLDVLWSATGLVGALSVQSDQPLVLRARTYNTAATGTFGVSLPVYASDHLIGEGQTADSLWVQQDPSGSSGFRTNVGVVFPDAAGGDAVVTFYDANGVAAGTLNYSSASAGFQQQSVASVAPAGLPIGRAEIFVARGHAAGYAVGVDNVTGDTSLYPLEALPAGVQDVVVNGVARLNGRNGTFFRTDARIYNPTPDAVTVTASFHAAGQTNPTPQSGTVSVPAGRIVEVVDVLGSILNAPVGSGGAVRFTAGQPIAILCRTSNVDPQGIQPGTFGAQQRPVPLASFLSSADAGAVVTAIRQDASFRTNVGFTAGPDGATYGMTLKNAAGATIAGAVGTLGAFGWTQASIADLFPGTAVPADATLLVNVASGTVDVYDASLDNASGDLVVTPIAPVPAALPSSASIGPTGGSIRSADGRMTLKVPAGALAAPTTLSIAPTTNGAPNAIGSGYTLSPVGVSFARPAQLVFAYSDSDLAGTGAGMLGIAVQEGTTWYGLLGGAVDTATGTLLVPVPSTSGRAVATGGRSPQRIAQNGNLGPYGSVIINPLEASVIEDGTRDLQADFVGPGAAQVVQSGAVTLPTGVPPSAIDVTWSVNIPYLYLGNFGGAGTIAPGAFKPFATYTAPHCAPRSLVEISAEVAINLQGQRTAWTVARARIRVVPAVWAIDVFYRLTTSCAEGWPWSIDLCRSHEYSLFRLRNDYQVAAFNGGPEHNNGTQPSSWCPAFDTGLCAQPTVSTITDLILTNVTGTLGGTNTLDPYFSLTLSATVPGEGAVLRFTCGSGQPAPQPIPHGAPGQVVEQVRINYPALKNYVGFNPVPAVNEEAEVVLRPVSCDGVVPPPVSACH